MTFLAPLAGLVGALFTLPPLLLFYFLRLRRRPLTVSSTMLWEQAVHDVHVNVPFRWIRPSTLLILHLLILALFLLALARPALEGGGGAASRAFFLIDTSCSMQATDAPEGAPRLDAAKQRALDVGRRLMRAPGGCSITVITFAHDAAIASAPADTLSGLRSALDAVEPTDQPGRLEPALRLVETLLSRDAAENESPTSPIVSVFSDGALFDQGPLSLAGATITFEPVPVAPPPNSGNVAIVACSAARDDANLFRARLFIRLQSTFSRPRPVTLAVLLDGQVLDRHAIVVPAQDSFGPGSIGRTFDLNVPGDALIACAIDAEDLLAADDAAAVYLPIALRPRVLLVHPDDSDADLFLADALREMPLRALRVMPHRQFVEVEQQARGQFDLLVFDRVSPTALPEVPTLIFGATLPGEPNVAGNHDLAGMILSWERRSPVMRDLTLDAVQVDRWLGPAPRAWLETLGRVSDLALARDGALITLLQTRRADHVLVRFAVSDSNWPLHFSFPVFLFNAVEELTGAGASRSTPAFTTTDPVVVRVLAPTPQLQLRGPGDRRITRQNVDAGPLSLGLFARTGVWQGAGIAPPVIAVNFLHADESRLESRTDLTIGGTSALPALQLEGLRELWPLLIAVAGALLLIEWFVYAARVRV